MPICKREGFENVQSRNKNEIFHDNEKVFYCDVTKEIFREYDDYFRHVMLINSTVWQCEATGRDNLTYAEARRSERRARRKMEQFKDALRPPIMLIIDQAKQSSLNALCTIASKFLRRRFFLYEEVTACNKSTKYHAYTVIGIQPPAKVPAPANGVYDDTDALLYKLRRTGNDRMEVVVPFDNIRRQRFELTVENLHMFVKNNVTRIEGILRPKPESYKRYVTDRGVTFASIFIGKMPVFTPAKIKKPPVGVVENGGGGGGGKKQSTLNKFLTKDGSGGDNNNKPNAAELERREKQRQQKAEAKAKSLRDEMERLRLEKQQRIVDQERQRQEARVNLLARVAAECDALLTKTDDLDRTDQRPLPKFTPIETYLPTKLLGDALMLREFMHSFAGVLSGMDAFRGNVNFYEMTRAFSVREVAGPLADIASILLGTILDLQREEEEECPVVYLTLYKVARQTLMQQIQSEASRSQFFTKIHYACRINALAVDPWTLSEVLRLHLLGSGAVVKDRTEKWRATYRNSYVSSEDPGLALRQQYPHILRALRMYTLYQLPFVDIQRVLRCLMAQILTYSTPLQLIDERMEQTARARIDLRNIMATENMRLSSAQAQRRLLTNEHNQACLQDEVRNNAALKAEMEERLNKKLAEVNAQSERERRKHDAAVERLQSSIFNFLVCLGMDRAYRRYYVLESMPGLFVEHPPDCMDTCLANPPVNVPLNAVHGATANLPRNRKDLRSYLMRVYTEEAKQLAKAEREGLGQKATAAAATLAVSQENKENEVNQQDDKKDLINGNDAAAGAAAAALPEAKASTTAGAVAADAAKKDVAKPLPSQYELYMCTGEPRNCIVHDERNADRQRWAYLYEKEDVEALIESLNPLGEREGALREQLTSLKTLILQHVRKCPAEMLSVEGRQVGRFKSTMMTSSLRGKYDKANFGLREGADLNEVMQLALIERIMQLEHDLYTGNLGQLKVKDMTKWRNDLLIGKYEPQAKLHWGPTHPMDGGGGGGGTSSTANTDNDADEAVDHHDEDDADDGLSSIGDPGESATARYHDPGESLGDTLEIDSEDSDDEGISLHDSQSLRANVRQLSSALLQVEQSIQRRFLKEPFGMPLKEIKDERRAELKKRAGVIHLKQWEVSLMESISYSQVFLHLNVLDEAIVWARSTNKSLCQVCRRGSDPEKMLLCDECNGGTHMFCMKPKMKTVPEGNWYCMRCVKKGGVQNAEATPRGNWKQQRAERVSKRKRHGLTTNEITKMLDADENYNEEEEEEEEDVDVDESEEEDEEVDENEDDNEDEEEGEAEDEEEDVAQVKVDQEEEEEDEEDVGDGVEEHLDEDGEEEEEEENEGINAEAETDEENAQDDDDDGAAINGDMEEGSAEEDDENVCVVCSYDGSELLCAMCKESYHLECINLKRTPRYNFICPKCKAPKEERKRRTRGGDDSEDDDDDDTTSSEPTTKRPRSSRTSLRNSLQNGGNTSTASNSQPENQRRSNRRTADAMEFSDVIVHVPTATSSSSGGGECSARLLGDIVAGVPSALNEPVPQTDGGRTHKEVTKLMASFSGCRPSASAQQQMHEEVQQRHEKIIRLRCRGR